MVAGARFELTTFGLQVLPLKILNALLGAAYKNPKANIALQMGYILGLGYTLLVPSADPRKKPQAIERYGPGACSYVRQGRS
jgi:hypothetical protein